MLLSLPHSLRTLSAIALIAALWSPNAMALVSLSAGPVVEDAKVVVKDAKALHKGGKSDDAIALLRKHLKRYGTAPTAHAELGVILLELEIIDQAAHHLAAARDQYLQANNKRAADKVARTLVKADPLWRKQQSLFSKMTRELSSAAEKLEDSEQPVRALDLFQRLLLIAEGKELKEIEAAVKRLRSAGAEVNLDAVGSEVGPDGKWPMVEQESKYYKLNCALEQEIIDRLAETVDSMYLYFVDLYFDGKNKKGPKAKLYIHADHADMMDHYPGAPNAGIGGWWSPGANEAHFYDTRDGGGSLDGLMDTLFHELGHQFMTKLTRGSGVPSWFNEGTSCFFEGAIAMADGSVTWPDAARSRLGAIRGQLRDEDNGKQLVEEALGFTGGGSFAGQYYSIGWGLVYFMQQWEHPDTLEYSYRDLYRTYRDEIVGKTPQSREMFEQVFLGKESPLGHQDFDAFYADWRTWILETVAPLFASSGTSKKVREKRVALINLYMEHAAAAGEQRKPLVSEQEFLLRALSHIEVVRSRLDSTDAPDYDLMLTQADVLVRLDRGKNAAPILEQFLDAVDGERHEVSEEEYGVIEERLAALDKRNSALRNLRSRMKSSLNSATRLLADYTEGDIERPLRAFSFASKASTVLADKGELADQAQTLRKKVRAAGLLLGRIESLSASASNWSTLYAEEPDEFRVRDNMVGMSAVRPNGKLLTSVVLSGEYEIRARLRRKGKLHLGSGHGIIVCGVEGGRWSVVGLDADGHIKLWKVMPSGTAAKTSRLRSITLSKAVEDDEAVDMIVHVFPDGKMEIIIEGREPVTARIPFAVPPTCHAGVFVRDGQMILEDPIVEIYP
ncbi:MAG: hypothetical protein ACI841_001160 [Planctomycetota bacterium]|jgi:hypothetical protein